MKTPQTLILNTIILLLLPLVFSSCLKDTYEINNCNTTTYLHTDPISLQAQALITGANLIGLSTKYKTLHFDSTASEAIMAEPPSSFKKNHTVDTTIVLGSKVLTLTPKTGATGKYVLFFHGGAYGLNVAASAYENSYGEIIKRTGVTIVLPDYKLAPYHTYKEAYALFQVVYDSLVAKVGAANVIIMGDSAGGALSIGFAQKLKIEGKTLPNQVIALSPWLDITLSNPEISNIQDPGLNAESLREAGIAWAGGTDLSFYQLSPINGPLEGLPTISIFIGGRDMFLPDNIKLRDKMSATCSRLNFYEYPQMLHVWMGLLPNAPESRKAYNQIADLINK